MRGNPLWQQQSLGRRRPSKATAPGGAGSAGSLPVHPAASDLFRGLYRLAVFQRLVHQHREYNYLRPDRTQFVGLQNYVNLFTPGSVQFPPFWNSLWNTVQFVIYSVPPLVVIPLCWRCC